MKKIMLSITITFFLLTMLTGCSKLKEKKETNDTVIMNENKPEYSIVTDSNKSLDGIYETEIYGFELYDVTIDKLIDINSSDNSYYDLHINDSKIELANTFSAVIFKTDDHYSLFIDVDYLNQRIGNGNCISINVENRQCIVRRRALENARILRCGSKIYISLKSLETTFNVRAYKAQSNVDRLSVEIDSHAPGVIEIDGKTYYAKETTDKLPSFSCDLIYSDGRGVWYDSSIHEDGNNYIVWLESDTGLIQLFEMK